MERLRVLAGEEGALADRVADVLVLWQRDDLRRKRNFRAVDAEVDRGSGGNKGTNARVGSVGAHDEVGGDDGAVREGDFVLTVSQRTRRDERVVPLDRVFGDSVKEDVADVLAVDLRARVLQVSARRGVLLRNEEQNTVLTGDPHLFSVASARVLDELVFEPVVAERALAALPDEVKHAAHMCARVPAGFALVKSSRDAALEKGDEEDEAARSA